jgi:hypothetical protein
MNKLSLVGMQLPEKYKENFDLSKGLRSNHQNSPYIFQIVHPYQRKFVHIIGTAYTSTDSSRS